MDSRAVALGVFVGAAAFSAWKWFSYSRELALQDRASTAKPKLSREALLAVIKECAKRVDAIIETTEAAVLAAAPAERARMTEGVAPSLKLDVEEMEEVVFAEQATTASEVATAFEYYTNGAGRNRGIADAASALRRKLGRHLMSKARLLGAIKQAFLWQVEHVTEGLNEAAEAAEQGGVNPNEAISRWMQQSLDACLQRTTGLGFQECMIKAQAFLATDPAFSQAFRELLQNGEMAVQQAIGRAAQGLGM